jgi:hypothetical protein
MKEEAWIEVSHTTCCSDTFTLLLYTLCPSEQERPLANRLSRPPEGRYMPSTSISSWEFTPVLLLGGVSTLDEARSAKPPPVQHQKDVMDI